MKKLAVAALVLSSLSGARTRMKQANSLFVPVRQRFAQLKVLITCWEWAVLTSVTTPS